jgi:hypothetical protein
MYEDEYLYGMENEHEDCNNSVADSSVAESKSVSSEVRKRQKIIKDSKMVDKGYHKVKRSINGKNIKIEFYSTVLTPGNCIRNAITGTRFKEYRVGSSDEYLFYKVGNSVDVSRKPGESLTLFYDSPEQWERHFRCELPQEEKLKWQRRRDNQWVKYT